VKRYDCTQGGAQYCYGCYTMTENEYGDYVRFDDMSALLREALEALWNLAPRIKNDRGGCFGDGGKDCTCTACKIRREIE